MSAWNTIERLVPLFQQVFPAIVDFERFNSYTLTFHSTALEGSTLNAEETNVLLDKGLAAPGKPLAHQLMVRDHQRALELVLDLAQRKVKLTEPLLKQIAGQIMQNTAGEVSTALGNYNVAQGDYRLGNMRAGNRYFVSYDKVPAQSKALIKQVEQTLDSCKTTREKLSLAFTSHYNLVMIHPFGDGNGRTARLLQNYIQAYHKLPISPVRVEQRVNYIGALEKATNEKTLTPFLEFMAGEYQAYLQGEISRLEEQKGLSRKATPKKERGKNPGHSLFF